MMFHAFSLPELKPKNSGGTADAPAAIAATLASGGGSVNGDCLRAGMNSINRRPRFDTPSGRLE
jgi:hypothetical protein